MEIVAALRVDHFVEIQRSREEHYADDGEGERNFVADHLRGAAHAAQQGIFAVGGPAGERHAVYPHGGDGEDEHQSDAAIRNDESRLPQPIATLGGPKGISAKRGNASVSASTGASRYMNVSAPGGVTILFEEKLQAVGQTAGTSRARQRSMGPLATEYARCPSVQTRIDRPASS